MRKRLALAGWLVVFACSSDAHVSCSPTLTCSLRPQRFAPSAQLDAGVRDCTADERACPVAQLSLGARHGCVVTESHSAICWGDNSDSQRGVDTTPVVLEDAGADAGSYLAYFARVVDEAQQVSAGAAHSCALRNDGTVLCWGRNVEGQLDGTTERASSDRPIPVPLSHVTQIAAGASHTCALTDQGVTCWGDARYGQTGRAPEGASPEPRLVSGTEGAREVSCGARHCCARMERDVVCWGELIDTSGAAYIAFEPVAVMGLAGALQISAGAGHSCALTADAVFCWGLNDDGQLGDGGTSASALPVRVTQLPSGAGLVAAGGGERDGRLVGHSCAVDRSAQVICWGRNTEGQLGRAVSSSGAPEPVQAYHADGDDVLSDISRVALGAAFSCALSSRGAVYCWGDDSLGELGQNADAPSQSDRRAPVAGEALRVPRFGRMR